MKASNLQLSNARVRGQPLPFHLQVARNRKRTSPPRSLHLQVAMGMLQNSNRFGKTGPLLLTAFDELQKRCYD